MHILTAKSQNYYYKYTSESRKTISRTSDYQQDSQSGKQTKHKYAMQSTDEELTVFTNTDTVCVAVFGRCDVIF